MYKYENMPEDVKQNQETLFPVLSNPLKNEFNVEPDEIIIKNRYKPYLRQIETFYKNHLSTPAFEKEVGITVGAFHKTLEKFIIGS